MNGHFTVRGKQMANKYMKTYSISLLIRLPKLRKLVLLNGNKDVGQELVILIAGGNIFWDNYFKKRFMFSCKLNICKP